VKIEVFFTPAEAATVDLEGRVAVVIDTLRATSTIVEALANGARGVLPAPSLEEAIRVAQNIGRSEVLLCGERRSLRVDGFDLGNSPLEFTEDRVGGRSLVMTTTNGTPAIVAGSAARRVLIASFLNLSAAAEAVASDGGPVAVVCAGRERRFALEDAICAGALIRRVAAAAGLDEGGGDWNDAARLAAEYARGMEGSLETVLRGTAAGRQLIEAGLEADIAYCATLDRHRIVPELRDHQMTL